MFSWTEVIPIIPFNKDLFAFLEALMTSAPVGLAYHDRELRFVLVNQTLARLHGLPIEQHLGRRMEEVLPRLAPSIEPFLAHVLHTGTPMLDLDLEGLPPNKDGEQRVWRASFYPIAEDGTLTGVGTVLTDITEQRRKELQKPECDPRLHAVIENSPHAYALISSEGKVLQSGPPYRQMLGYAMEDFVGSQSLSRIHPDDYDRVSRELLELRHSPGSSSTLQYRTRHQNGDWRWIEGCGINLTADPKVGAIVIYYRDITETKAMEEQLTFRAYHDPLTLLPNRTHFINSLEKALEQMSDPDGLIAVMFIDLDGFKLINDSMGHSVGDELLQDVSRRFGSSLRDQDILARMGGDEFTILLQDVSRPEQAEEVAKRILVELKHPFYLNKRDVYISASIGIAFTAPGAMVAGDLLRRADIALYEAKKKGKACYETFDLSMSERVWRRLELETDLRRALDNNELKVYYQPVIDLHSGRMVELEALVRWDHPKRGFLLPMEFLPMAEETGQILDIDLWVLQTAAQEVCDLRNEFPELAKLNLSVNFSSKHFLQERLVERIDDLLRNAGMEPKGLKIEFTENLIHEDRELVIATLTDLKKRGIRLSIDDFGTGNNAMNSLKRYPLDILKVDRSFNRELRGPSDRHETDSTVVRKIFTFGKALGMGVTGEGIENLEQLNELRDLGCKFGQGYYFARPQPMDELRTLLSRTSKERPFSLPTGIYNSLPGYGNGH